MSRIVAPHAAAWLLLIHLSGMWNWEGYDIRLSKQWSNELTVFTRAYAGAAVFGIPFVFTLEMWGIGQRIALNNLLIVVAMGFAANVLLSYVGGFRTNYSVSKAFDQAIDAFAVGVVSAAVLMIALNQWTIASGLSYGVGVVLFMAVPLSLGASVAKEVFSESAGREAEDISNYSTGRAVMADALATMIGGLFIGVSVAPTDEVELLASGINTAHLVLIIVLSLVLSYIIVFASGFDEVTSPGPFQHPVTETALAYIISLIVALCLLLVFEGTTVNDPQNDIIKHTIVLALPVSIGGAGGRLVV